MKKLVLLLFVLFLSNLPAFSQTWEAINFNNKGLVNQVYSYSNYIYVSSYGIGIYISSDYGSTWTKTQINSGSLSKFIVFNNSLYSSSLFEGIYVSNLNLGNINKKNVGLPNNSVLDFIIDDDIFYLSLVGNGIMYSADTCNTWKLLNSTIQDFTITSLYKNDKMFVATALDYGVLVSTDNGENWEICKTGLADTKLSDCEIIDDKIVVTSHHSGVYVSTDFGKTWSPKNSGLSDFNITTLKSSGNNLIVGTNGNGVFTSTNYGESWTKQELTNNMTIYSIDLTQEGKVIIGTSNGGFLVSYDGKSFYHPIPFTFNSQSIVDVRSLAVFGNLVFAGSDDKGLIRSVDEGNTWSFSNDGLPLKEMYDMDMIDNVLFASIMEDGVYYSTNYGNTWQPTGLVNIDTRSLLVVNKVLYAASTTNGIYKSENMGTTWISLNPGFDKIAVDLLQVGDTLYLGTWGDGIYYSTDSCKSWSKMTSYKGNQLVKKLIINNEKMYVGAFEYGLYSYNFNTKTWSHEIYNFPNESYAILSIEDNLFVGRGVNEVYLRKKNSFTFENISKGLNGFIMALANSKNYIFAGSTYLGGIFRLPLSVLGITSVDSENLLITGNTLVYPNPANDFIIININKNNDINYEIYDLFGRKLLEGIYQNQNKIDISNLQKGIYFIKFDNEFFKFIKN